MATKPTRPTQRRVSASQYWNAQKEAYGADWKQVSSDARRAAGNRCVLCASTYKLQTHHIRPVNPLNPDPFQNDPSNLLVLCETCHSDKFHPHMARNRAKRGLR